METEFYAPVKAIHVSGENLVLHKTWLQERGLNGACDMNGKHGWLFLPKIEHQKQYLICIYCLENGHT